LENNEDIDNEELENSSNNSNDGTDPSALEESVEESEEVKPIDTLKPALSIPEQIQSQEPKNLDNKSMDGENDFAPIRLSRFVKTFGSLDIENIDKLSLFDRLEDNAFGFSNLDFVSSINRFNSSFGNDLSDYRVGFFRPTFSNDATQNTFENVILDRLKQQNSFSRSENDPNNDTTPSEPSGPEPLYVFVDNSFIGTSDGTEDNPFTVVQEAIDAAIIVRNNNDPQSQIIVEVKEGNSNTGSPYDGFNLATSNIIVQSHQDNTNRPRVETLGDDSPGAISGSWGTIEVIAQSNVTIDGFYVANSHNYGIYVSGTANRIDIPDPENISSNINIINNKVESTDNSGIYTAGIEMFYNPREGEYYLSNVLIKNNDVSFTNVGSANNEAISVGGGLRDFKIIGNTVYDSEQYGIDVKSGAINGVVSYNHVYNIERHGIYVEAGNRTVENVLITDNLIHNVRNGIVVTRESKDSRFQLGDQLPGQGGVATGTPEPELRDIIIDKNIVFATEQYGALFYRHNSSNTKDIYDGDYDFTFTNNTIAVTGMDLWSKQGIKTSINLIDESLPPNPIETITNLKINDTYIIQNGILTYPINLSDSNEVDAFENILIPDNRLLHQIEYDQNNVNQNGNDILYLGSGNDFAQGQMGDDIIFGGDGNDTVIGNNGNDFLVGDGSNSGDFKWDLINLPDFMVNSGNDTIKGNNGDDIIIGLSGDDIVEGGAGDDILYGNDGADTFRVLSVDLDGQIDVIKDFSLSENDIIDIADVLSSYDPLSDILTDFVQITDDGTNSSVFVDIDGGADSFVQILSLENITGITDEIALVDNGHLVI